MSRLNKILAAILGHLNGALSISGTPVTIASQNVPYAGFTATASGGTAPYTYSLVGSWPTGITVNSSNGIVSGTPTVNGSFTGLSIRVTDNLGATVNLANFSITVAVGIALSGTPVLTATQGIAYAGFTVAAIGGTAPYTYSLVGSWPVGISINPSTGAISGTPTISGNYTSLNVRVTDNVGAQATLSAFSINVATSLAINGTPATTATQNFAYPGFTATASGGTAPYTYALVGTWPTGVTVDGFTGVVSGTPTNSGSFTGLSIRATDQLGVQAQLGTFTITVAAAMVVTGTPTPPTIATKNWAFPGFTASATGGTGAKTYSLVGTWPNGVTVNPSSGVVSGTPTNAGIKANLSIRATDSLGATSDMTPFTVDVANTLTISGTPIVTATQNVVYAGFEVTRTGGSVPRTFSLLGTWPTGITIDPSSGLVSGTPTNSGSFTGLSVRITDGIGAQADLASFNLTVAAEAGDSVRSMATFGGNSGFPDYYVERPVFANAVLQGGMFRVLNLNTPVSTDANGNPLTDFSQILWTLQSAGSDSYYLGTYKCTATFPGRPGSAPTITYTTDGTVSTANKVYSSATGIMTWDMVVSAMGVGSLSYNISGTGGGATDIAIWRPGINPASPPVFSALETRLSSEFATLRCMDLDQVNVATITDWANRNTPANWKQGSDRYQAGLSLSGVPNEYITALYSEANATTLWRCCPTTLTTLSSWATLLASSLPVGKKVVVEMSNEVWNSAFAYTYHTNYKSALIATGARRLLYNNATYSSNDTALLIGEYFSPLASVSGITSNGTTATMTFTGAHGLSNGNMLTVGLQAGWDVGSVGSISPAVAPTSVAYTVASSTTITYPCSASGTMSMAPNGAAGVFFTPTSPFLVGIQGIYDINLRRHAYRTRELGIAAKAAFTTAGRLADLDVNVSWQSGATDQMQTILGYMDYLNTVDGLGSSAVIDSIGFAIYCDLTLDRIAGAGLTDQTPFATTPTEILDAIETQVDYAERAYSLSNYTALARDKQKKLRIYELGIDTQGAWNKDGGVNHANVITANEDARMETILKKLIDAFYKAGADQINFYRLSVGSYGDSGCFYIGKNSVEADPLTSSGSQSNRMRAIQQVLNAAPAAHTRHLLTNSGTVTTIDGRDRINYTQWTGADQFPTIGSAGYFDILRDTHLGYEVTAPAAGVYKLQLRVLLTTTNTATGYIRLRGANVASFSVPNRGGSNTVDENLATVTLTLEKGVNYFYIGGLTDQSQNGAFKIKALTMVDNAYAFPVGISGTPALTANVNQPYTGFTAVAFNGVTPYVYSLVGSWPAGITINSSSGAVSGTPTVSGTFTNLSVRVTDSTSGTPGTADLPVFTLGVTVGDALVASDNFNALANGTILRSEAGWGAYNSAGSTSGLRDLFTAQSGVATWPNDIGDDYSYPGTFIIGRDLGTDQQAVEFEFSVTPGASALFWICAANQNDGIFLNMPSPGNDSLLEKRVAGVTTTLATFTGVSFASGDKVMIRRYGSNCAVYKNDVLVQSNIAIGTFTGGTKAGAGSYLRLGAYNYINWYGPITQLLKP